MSLFDSIKNKAQRAGSEAVRKLGQEVAAAASGKTYTVTLSTLPMSVEELKAMPEGNLKQPENTAALTIAALAVYPSNPDASIAMINYMRNGRDLIGSELQFVKERGVSHNHVILSYFKGATPDNDYTPSEPAVIELLETSTSRAQIKDGYLKLFVQSGGADAPPSHRSASEAFHRRMVPLGGRYGSVQRRSYSQERGSLGINCFVFCI